jgi:hypothetical protein
MSEPTTLMTDPEVLALLDFEPVPRARAVEGGWTPELQREFIARLAVTGSAGLTCDEMGKNLTGVTKVYRNPNAESFREAWHGAVELAKSRRAAASRFVEPGTKPPTLDNRRRQAAAVPAPIREQWAPLPVVCDSCACAGIAGDENFVGIRDILAFEPVRGSFQDRDWDEERQRAFIANLAVTGSVGMAAKAIGRHELGAERLRKARGGREFSEAWDAAIEIAREREIQRRSAELKQLDGADADARASWPFVRADDLVNDPDDNPHERLIQKLLRIKARLERERAEEDAASAEKQGEEGRHAE